MNRTAGQGRGGIQGCAAGGKVSDRASGRVRLYDGRLWYVRVLRWRLMTTAYAFSDYKDCCHKHNLPSPPPSSPSMACTGSLRFTRRTRGLLYFPGSGGMTLPVLRPWRRSSRTSGKRWGRKMSISSCMISWVMALAWG